MESEQNVSLHQNAEVAITLTAEQWANVLVGVDELPRRIAQPIVGIINGEMIKAAKDAEGSKEVVVPEEAGGGDK
jgi:hypothetical protein